MRRQAVYQKLMVWHYDYYYDHYSYRYQNQRHPSNRVAVKGTTNHTGSTGPVTLGDHMPSQFIAVSGTSTSNKREPLLPTPPSTQMVKLDTNLTCKIC